MLSYVGLRGAAHFWTLAALEQDAVPVILHPFLRHSAREPWHCCFPEHELVEFLAQLKQVWADALPAKTKVHRISAAAQQIVIRKRFKASPLIG